MNNSYFLSFSLLVWTSTVVAQPQIKFTDVTAQAQLEGQLYASDTNHSLGVVWLDIDADGLPDLFVTNGFGTSGPHLYRNLGNGKFRLVDQLMPSFPDREYVGARTADYDQDGDPDLYVYTAHETWMLSSQNNPPDGPPNLLLKNLMTETGTPRFTDVAAAAGVDDCPPQPFGNDYPCFQTRTAAFLDYDRDGCIDLFVGHMVINNPGEDWNRNRMYRQIPGITGCSGQFQDTTDQAGIQPDPSTYRASLVTVAADLNGDLWPDLYVGNVGNNENLVTEDYNDQILLNSQGTFQEVLVGHGDDTPASMGIDLADVDLDGDFDIYITDVYTHQFIMHDDGNTFYMNQGNGLSDNMAPEAQIDAGFSWGTNFIDADQDGDQDLFVGLSGVPTNPDTALPFHENVGTGFLPLDTTGIITQYTRGSALADFDGDGDLDIVLVNDRAPGETGGTLKLWRNDSLNTGHFLKVRLEGTLSNRDAIGALVTVETPTRLLKRQLKGGTSAHSQDFAELHFGLGSESITRVGIRWPSGQETILNQVQVDSTITVVEPNP